MRATVLYEDNYILAVHKPSGLATQTSRLGQKDLYSECMNYLSSKDKNGKPAYIAIINRLDQPVSGIVLMAKDRESAAKLSDMLHDDRMQKYYEAVVFGNMATVDCESHEDGKGIKEESGAVNFSHRLTDYIYTDKKNNLSRICGANTPGAKRAVLEYEVLEGGEYSSRLYVHLLTGRHHQIRVQLAGAGHPILGDRRYGTEKSQAESERAGVNSVALKACKLEFIHPKSGELIVIRDEID